MFGLSSIGAYFKRIIAVFSALIIFLSSGMTAQVSVTQMLVRGVAPKLLSVPSYSFYEPTVKIQKTGALEKNAEHTIYVAKNESEYCQLAVQARLDRTQAVASLSEFTNENGDTLETVFCEEYFIKTTGETVMGSYPDALIPIAVGAEYEIPMVEMQNYPMFIGVKTTKDTVPGDYTAKFTLYCTPDRENEYEKLELEITAHVWDFELPDDPAMDTAMGLGWGDIARAHHVDSGSAAAKELYKTYYEFLLEHHVSAYNLPVDILSDEADVYMSDPRCTSFCIPYAGDDTIRAYRDKLQSNPEWAAKAYFYPIDEPHSTENVNAYNSIIARLRSVWGDDFHMVTPFYGIELKDDETGEIIRNLEVQSGNSDILCPETVCLSNKDFCDAIADRAAQGDKIWWYVCCGPGPKTDYCNLFTQQDGIKHRILFWQQKQYDVTGLLYWSTTYWTDVGGDPWTSAWTTPWTGVDTFGDGSLMYDGYHVGVNGPVSSLRLEAVANGIEDYEYLTMAQQLLGDDYMNKTISKVAKDLTNYTLSDAQFAKVRVELGNAIEAAVNG
ncbi:MAG: DUF4091 domain-containing protein [Clostridia bacterium]|nr:DUF4091 domain-containing protein [Clostridia bacterium]